MKDLDEIVEEAAVKSREQFRGATKKAGQYAITIIVTMSIVLLATNTISPQDLTIFIISILLFGTASIILFVITWAINRVTKAETLMLIFARKRAEDVNVAMVDAIDDVNRANNRLAGVEANCRQACLERDLSTGLVIRLSNKWIEMFGIGIEEINIRLGGLTEREMAAEIASMVVVPEELVKLTDHIYGRMNGGKKSGEFNTTLFTKDGRLFPALLTCHYIDLIDIKAVQVFIEDQTDVYSMKGTIEIQVHTIKELTAKLAMDVMEIEEIDKLLEILEKEGINNVGRKNNS